MAARIFRLEWASELASIAGLDGVGAGGVSIGTTGTQFTTTIGTTPVATHFITEAITTVVA